MKYKRVLLKLSGEALMGNRQYGIDNDRLVEYAKEIKKVVDKIKKAEPAISQLSDNELRAKMGLPAIQSKISTEE